MARSHDGELGKAVGAAGELTTQQGVRVPVLDLAGDGAAEAGGVERRDRRDAVPRVQRREPGVLGGRAKRRHSANARNDNPLGHAVSDHRNEPRGRQDARPSECINAAPASRRGGRRRRWSVNAGTSGPSEARPIGAGRGRFARIRVFSKKLFGRGGAHFGGYWGAPRRDGIPASDRIPRRTCAVASVGTARAGWGRSCAVVTGTGAGASPGEGSAAPRGRRDSSIRTWGCVDIGPSVHYQCTQGNHGLGRQLARSCGQAVGCVDVAWKMAGLRSAPTKLAKGWRPVAH